MCVKRIFFNTFIFHTCKAREDKKFRAFNLQLLNEVMMLCLFKSVVRIAGFISVSAIVYFFQVHQAFADPPKARAFPINEDIRIDGRLDEPAWEAAAPIGDLIQVLPKEGDNPGERTEVRVLVSKDSLFFGITCFDSSPASIIATQLTRDAYLDVDDNISIVIDPYFDHRNGFFFEINPNGARADGQISNNADFASLDWDGIWNTHARITLDGWVAEIEIPFKTLRFKPGQSVWGLNIQRVIKRNNEINRWASARQDVWLSNLAEAGQLEGLSDARQGMGSISAPMA
jgi:hypothetical protein